MGTIERLAEAVLTGEQLAARALAQQILRAGNLTAMPAPDPARRQVAIMAAGLAELLASYAGVPAPPWTSQWGPMPAPVDLLPATSERLRRLLAEGAPEPLRRRNILAPDGFLRAV